MVQRAPSFLDLAPSQVLLPLDSEKVLGLQLRQILMGLPVGRGSSQVLSQVLRHRPDPKRRLRWVFQRPIQKPALSRDVLQHPCGKLSSY